MLGFYWGVIGVLGLYNGNYRDYGFYIRVILVYIGVASV